MAEEKWIDSYGDLTQCLKKQAKDLDEKSQDEIWSYCKKVAMSIGKNKSRRF